MVSLNGFLRRLTLSLSLSLSFIVGPQIIRILNRRLARRCGTQVRDTVHEALRDRNRGQTLRLEIVERDIAAVLLLRAGLAARALAAADEEGGEEEAGDEDADDDADDAGVVAVAFRVWSGR